MFRSVANLVAHKRSFCTQRLQDVKHVYSRDPSEYPTQAISSATPTTVLVQPEEPVDTVVPEKEWDFSQYSHSLELLKEAGFISEIENQPVVKTLKPAKGKQGLEGVVNWLKEKQINGFETDYYRQKEAEHIVRLEPMTQTSKAVFQVIDGFKT